jgi:hypothetical protein
MAETFSREMVADGGRGSSFFLAILAGLLAAFLGSLLWTVVQVAMNLQIGFVAIVIGIMVGYAVRVAGNGRTVLYGILGALLTFAGCLGGEILAILYNASSAQQSILDLLRTTDFVSLIGLIFTKMDVISYVIYAIGVFEGYKLSIVK